MPLRFAGLMCHAPIVIPSVGGERGHLCVRTTRAMGEVATRAVAAQPDRVVVISPHAPRRRDSWGAWRGPHRGDLGQFWHPEISIALPDAPEVAQRLSLPPVSGQPMDHGSMVPLHFLFEAGWRGPTAILALPWDESLTESCEAIGAAIAALPGQTVVIASGDMSHRLKPGAPAGYHPNAQDFDHGFVAALRAEDWDKAKQVTWQQEAAEDVVDSTRVAMGAAGGPLNAEVLSYEGPWGVGYTEAILCDPSPPLYAVARMAVVARAHGTRPPVPSGGPTSKGVFVTLRTLRGDLRGCIGHIQPCRERLYDEVVQAAVAAATRDPRFSPVKPSELDNLSYEVSVLGDAEPIESIEMLDPRRYGVIVTAGERRGLLLPDIEGIDRADQQVAIAQRKAEIGPKEPVQLQRFEVIKVAQP